MNKKFKVISTILSVAIIGSALLSSTFSTKANEVEQNSDMLSVGEHILNTDENTSSEFSMNDLKYNLKTAKLVELKSVDKLREYIDGYNASNEIPSSYDNSTSNYFPPVGNQGQLGSCNSWAAVYYQMSFMVNKELDRSGKVYSNIMSPSFMYTLTNKGVNNGSNYLDVLKVLSDIGVVSTAIVPIVTQEKDKNIRTVYADNKDIYMEASKYRVKEYYTIGTANAYNPQLTEYSDEDIDSIKKALSMGQVLTMTTYPNRWVQNRLKSKINPSNGNEYIITKVSGTDRGSHRMAIVGYDDNISFDINQNGTIEDAEKGAFKIANSWGANWGNKGFIWMSYDAVKIKSKADANEVNNKERTTGLFNIVGYTVDVNAEDDPCYLMIDIDTQDLQSVELVIDATDKDNKKYTYEPAPFSNGMIYGSVGPYPFNMDEGGSKGQIYVDLTKLDSNLNKDNIDEYNWSFKFKDTSELNSVYIKDVKFYFKETDTYSDSLIDNQIILSNTERYVTEVNDFWNLIF